MKLSDHKCVFTIKELVKQTAPRHINTGRVITLKGYAPDRRLCPIVLLKAYLARTKPIRKDPRLFLTWVRPNTPATPATISRWIKSTLKDAGIDTTVFSGHSTRTASTSAAARAAVPMKEIIKTAGWASETTFAKYYNKPLRQQAQFQDGVLDRH